MTALTLIAEPFPDWEAAQHLAAARDLTIAVATTAPRACSARYLAARGEQTPTFSSPRIRTEHLPVTAKTLPLLWRSGASARPLDGEFMHAISPLAPLRAREEDDGSQTTVMVPHGIAWEAPELLGSAAARMYRHFARRAAKFADVILTPTHATAVVLQQQFGENLPVQVFQLAPLTEFMPASTHAVRRAELYLPERYAVTTAPTGAPGRLEWIFDALRADPNLPPVVVLTGIDPAAPLAKGEHTPTSAEPTVPDDLGGRVIALPAQSLSDTGAVLSGAELLLQPQSYTGTGYILLGALSSGVPVLHSGHAAATELVLDAGVIAEDASTFAAEFSRLCTVEGERTCLDVIARDLSRSYSWENTAWKLWETHANL